jgi:hypothetical protein
VQADVSSWRDHHGRRNFPREGLKTEGAILPEEHGPTGQMKVVGLSPWLPVRRDGAGSDPGGDRPNVPTPFSRDAMPASRLDAGTLLVGAGLFRPKVRRHPARERKLRKVPEKQKAASQPPMQRNR